MKRYLPLIAVILVWSLTASAAKPQSPELDAAAHVGVYVYDIEGDSVVAKCNEAHAFTPASVMKSLTTAAVMLTIGPDFRFSTPVRLIGDCADGRFKGVMEIVASGDPTIDSEHFKGAGGLADSIVAALCSRGIKSFDGSIKINEKRFTPTGPRGRWQIHDVAWPYGAAFHGFNYRDNTVNVNLATMKAPAAVGLEVERGLRTGSVDLTRGAGSDLLVVDGAPGKQTAIETTVPDPAYYFYNVLVQKINDAGIATNLLDADNTPKPANRPAETIYTHLSPRAYDICRSLMCRSDNLFADAMQRALSPSGSLDAAIKVEEEAWRKAGVDLGPRHIYDGSGLIRNDLLTPAGLGRALRHMADKSDYYTLFPLCGKEGTVRSMLKGTRLEGRMALKSGSMSGVRCYAGYKLGADGRPTHVVVLMVNNSFRSSGAVREALERFLLAVL